MQIAELNAYLELLPQDSGKKRALKAAGIGNGQTIAGAVSGNTHGSQINFGAMPDFVVGLHIATGSGQTLWIEKASKPVFNEDFAAKIGAKLIRDDEIFNAAVVSFGTFGIIAAMAMETAPDLPGRLSGDRRHPPRRPEDEAHGIRQRRSGGSLPLRVHLRSP